jgi:hypothetical protein
MMNKMEMKMMNEIENKTMNNKKMNNKKMNNKKLIILLIINNN